jgi:hypothetical protein
VNPPPGPDVRPDPEETLNRILQLLTEIRGNFP